MEIKSKFLGNQQINPETIITFPKGIPGFEAQKRYKLFHKENEPIVFWLQAVDDEDLTFSVAPPDTFNIHYSFLLTDDDLALLQLDHVDDLLILILLHTDNGAEPHKPTIKGSIKSPLLINSARKLGMQKCLGPVEQSITLTETRNTIELEETR